MKGPNFKTQTLSWDLFLKWLDGHSTTIPKTVKLSADEKCGHSNSYIFNIFFNYPPPTPAQSLPGGGSRMGAVGSHMAILFCHIMPSAALWCIHTMSGNCWTSRLEWNIVNPPSFSREVKQMQCLPYQIFVSKKYIGNSFEQFDLLDQISLFWLILETQLPASINSSDARHRLVLSVLLPPCLRWLPFILVSCPQCWG